MSTNVQALPKSLEGDGDLFTLTNTEAYPLDSQSLCALQLTWTTADITGDFQLQASVDGTTWENTGSTVAAGGANGTNLFLLVDVPYRLIRLNFSITAGTAGTFTLKASAKKP